MGEDSVDADVIGTSARSGDEFAHCISMPTASLVGA